MSKYQTEQRKKLLELFAKNPHKSFSIQEITDFLQDFKISTSSIYRNISEMVNDGVLHKVSEKNRSTTVYRYVDPIHCEGIIHFKCQNCDKTYHLNRSISHMVIDFADEEFSFNVYGASAFLYGECNNCSQKQRR